MVICVWKDINNFHSEVHKVIQDIIPTKYGLLVSNTGTPVARLAAIKAEASRLAYKFRFLQGEPDDFIKGVLDMYATHGEMKGKMSPAKNEDDFWKMYCKMQQVIEDEYHGPKLAATLQEWAREAYATETWYAASDGLECKINLD
ncbi:hypothetical protein V8E55_011859 [Tylopilus felleus]